MRYILILSLFIIFAPSRVVGEVKYRGFQVSLEQITPEVVEELATVWRVNLIRFQIGDNERMDGLTGTPYIEMMERQFQLFDAIAPSLESHGIKAVFALYSPPGGFATREAPSHYQMFSDRLLQLDYISMWERIITRYKDSTVIAAFDLLNEPALRKELVCSECKGWSPLLKETINSIRVLAPTATLMVKSVYGDPTKLASLPLFDDPNIIYSYHAYPFLNYQHAGIEGFDADTPRPESARVHVKLTTHVARFFKKFSDAYQKGAVSFYPPRLNVGEFAVSACSTQEPHLFLRAILEVLEGEETVHNEEGTETKKPRRCQRLTGKAKRKCKRKKNRNKRTGRRGKRNKKDTAPDPLTEFRRQIVHESWTSHAFQEARIWDPRYSCEGDEFSYVGTTTERALVLLEYLTKNQPYL